MNLIFAAVSCSHLPARLVSRREAVKAAMYTVTSSVGGYKIIIWHVEPLLGNDGERISYTTAVTE
jgi:hypothetical protein